MAKVKLREHHIIREWCKGCGICVRFCPKHVLQLDDQDKVYAEHPEKCVCCRMCEMRCPDLSITIVTEEEGGQG